MDIQQVVAFNIQRIRLENGLSQEALAEDARVSRTLLSRLETGEGNPTVAVLDRLAGALGAQIVDFFKSPRGQPKAKALPRGPKGPR